jgi:uncharacterized protein YodC (DUF2158 family)
MKEDATFCTGDEVELKSSYRCKMTNSGKWKSQEIK